MFKRLRIKKYERQIEKLKESPRFLCGINAGRITQPMSMDVLNGKLELEDYKMLKAKIQVILDEKYAN